jgi:hypothetical protein
VSAQILAVTWIWGANEEAEEEFFASEEQLTQAWFLAIKRLRKTLFTAMKTATEAEANLDSRRLRGAQAPLLHGWHAS